MNLDKHPVAVALNAEIDASARRQKRLEELWKDGRLSSDPTMNDMLFSMGLDALSQDSHLRQLDIMFPARCRLSPWKITLWILLIAAVCFACGL